MNTHQRPFTIPMSMKSFPRSLAAVCALALAPLAFAAESAALPKSAPITIIVVRHGEKSATSGDVPLSGEGRARAAALAATLEPAGVTAVFSSELTFAQETAAPLAQQRNLTPTIVPVREAGRLLAALENLPPGAVALVVTHSNTIPLIVEKLGSMKPPPVSGFDRMFIITRAAGSVPSAVELRYAPPTL
jgi:broad specificity phosphatase PhoE